MTAALAREHAGLRGTAIQIARAVLRRDLPDWALAALGEATSLIFVLSPHAPLEVARLGEPGVVHVFARFDPALMRRAHVRRVEVVGPLSALADDTRLRILELLTKHDELCAQDVIEMLDLSQSAASRHLRQLTATGYLIERRREVAKCYSLNPQRVDDTLHALKRFLRK